MDVHKVNEIVAGGSLPMADFAIHPLAFLTLSFSVLYTEKYIVLNGGMVDVLERIHNEAILA